MFPLISFLTILMGVCFTSGIVAIVYGFITRTWPYVVIAPISMYCSCEFVSFLNEYIVKNMA